MKIKSEYSQQRSNFFQPLFNLINEQAIAISITSIVIILILTIGKTKEPPPLYDCSSLSTETQLLLTNTINHRLDLIKESMNTALVASGFEREDMQDTIEQIMYDTRKEYCIPIKE